MTYDVMTPKEYIEALPEDRKPIIEKLRNVILDNLPQGFEEQISYGMIGYAIPLYKYPKGYHVTKGEPLPFLSIASQKNHIAVYHMAMYMDKELEKWFREAYEASVPTKLDMGKSCIRFKNPKNIPYELIGELCKKITPKEYISLYENSLKGQNSSDTSAKGQEDSHKKIYEFQGEIKKVPDMDGAYIEFPYDIRKEFGKGRVKVHASFDGVPYDGSIVNMGVKGENGSICYIIGIRKDIRAKIGKQPGDFVNVKLQERE